MLEECRKLPSVQKFYDPSKYQLNKKNKMAWARGTHTRAAAALFEELKAKLGLVREDKAMETEEEYEGRIYKYGNSKDARFLPIKQGESCQDYAARFKSVGRVRILELSISALQDSYCLSRGL